jgi:hypothetical protein
VWIGTVKATVTQPPLQNIALGQAEDSLLHRA